MTQENSGKTGINY